MAAADAIGGRLLRAIDPLFQRTALGDGHHMMQACTGSYLRLQSGGS